MLRCLRKLTAHVTNAQSSNHSVFEYLRKTGTDLATTNHPTDLESLVRLVTAIDSFKYPAFHPALRSLVARGDDSEWLERIQREAESVPQNVALQYFRALAPAEIPAQLLVTLLKRLTIQSRQDIAEFIAAVSALPASQFNADVRNATTYVVKNAAVNNCRLSLYNDIFDLLNKTWRTTHKHLIPTKLRTELVEAGWTAFLKLDMSGKDSEFADAVRWLSMGESVRGRKDEIERMLLKVEARGKSFLQHDLIPGLLKSVLSYRQTVVPEPLDSIAQLLARKLNFAKISATQLEDLVAGLSIYLDTRHKAPQLESVVTFLLPALVSALKKNVSTIPSRSLPAVLGLLARSGETSMVMDEIEHRGHEMDVVELVKLVNSLEWTDGAALKNLFAVKLGDAEYVEGLLKCLDSRGKLELLASLACAGMDLNSPDIGILSSALKEAITADAASSTGKSVTFEPETIVKMFVAGDSTFANTGVAPSELLVNLLESPESSNMSLGQTLRLLGHTADKPEIAKSLFSHAESFLMDAGDAVEFLRATAASLSAPEYMDRALKKLVPLIGQIEEVEQLLRLIPSELGRQTTGSFYAPANQLREELWNRLDALCDRMSSEALMTCIEELGRMSGPFARPMIVEKLIKRAVEIGNSPQARLATSGEHAISLIYACRKLGVYNGDLLDLLVRDFFSHQAGTATVSLVDELARALVDMGNKNDAVLAVVEKALRETDNVSVKISLLNTLGKSGVFSPLFMEQFRFVVEEAGKNISALSDADWTRLFETHLVVLIESPPRIKVRFANDAKLKAFIDDNCAFSWYSAQERQRNDFIYSVERPQIAEAMESLGWTNMRVPELGKEVYHVDFASEDKVAVVTVPQADELSGANGVRVIVGPSMTKIKHLQLFGYKVVPVWLREWRSLDSADERKRNLLRNSTQVVYALGTTKSK